MNYLFRYLSMLRPQEVEALDELRVTPRERDTLNELISLRSFPDASKAQVMERLGMNGSMFDKTCSTLLRGILERAVPEGGVSLLEHLVERAIYDLLLHEMRRQEKEAIAAGDDEILKRFYADAFRVVHLRFSSEYPERLGRQIAVRYRRLDPSPDTLIYTEARLSAMAIWKEASRRTGDGTRERLERRLRRNDRRITESTGPIARFIQLKSWLIYYGQLKRDPESRMAVLRESARLCDAHPDVLTREDKVLTLCQLAEEHYYYKTDLVTPLLMYRELYELYPEELRKEDYHTFKFIQLSTINGDYGTAEDLLVRYFGQAANLVVHGGGRSKDVALLWTKLRLMQGRTEEARKHLDDAVLLNQKGFYFQFEVECRMLHSVISFLEGNFEIIEQRFPAHIKFLRSKGATYKTSRYYPWFFKLMVAFIDERTTGRKLSPSLTRKFEEFMEGPAAQYGMLLRKMRGMER